MCLFVRTSQNAPQGYPHERIYCKFIFISLAFSFSISCSIWLWLIMVTKDKMDYHGDEVRTFNESKSAFNCDLWRWGNTVVDMNCSKWFQRHLLRIDCSRCKGQTCGCKLGMSWLRASGIVLPHALGWILPISNLLLWPHQQLSAGVFAQVQPLAIAHHEASSAWNPWVGSLGYLYLS